MALALCGEGWIGYVDRGHFFDDFRVHWGFMIWIIGISGDLVIFDFIDSNAAG